MDPEKIPKAFNSSVICPAAFSFDNFKVKYKKIGYSEVEGNWTFKYDAGSYT